MTTNDILSKKRKISPSDVSTSSIDKIVTPQPPTRSTKYWFEDGNFLLQAGNTQFKVHQSVLTARCTFFRDGFEKYQEGSPASTSKPSSLDPLLVALPSSVEEVELLLAFLYDGLSTWKLCSTRYAGGEFPVSLVSAMLRMGAKSGFTELRNEGITLLREFLPNCRTASLHIRHYLSPHFETKDEFADKFANIIVLGHEHALLFVLISAYWTILNSYSLEKIVQIFTTLPSSQKAKLRLNEPATTLLGRERIRSWTARFMLSLTRDKKIPCNQSCKTPEQCFKIMNDFTLQTLESADTSVVLRYALCSDRRCQDGDVAAGLCVACLAVYMRERQAGWESLWVDFATVFGLKDNSNIAWVIED